MTPRNSNDPSRDDALLAYIVNLEIEVDRNRQHNRRVQEEIRRILASVQPSSNGDTQKAINAIFEMLAELEQIPEFDPADDQVISISIRPLAERIFRYHQRWSQASAKSVSLKFTLESESINWFPSRFRHILENLFTNSLKFCDPEKADMEVTLDLRTADPEWYMIRLTDNGIGMDVEEINRAANLRSRANLLRGARPEVGLAIVKQLLEHSGGALAIKSELGTGTTIDIALPRYDLKDYLT